MREARLSQRESDGRWKVGGRVVPWIWTAAAADLTRKTRYSGAGETFIAFSFRL